MNAGTGFLIVISLFNMAAMVVFYLLMKSRFSTKKILAEIRSEVDKLVSDLGREADRDVALLESRIKNLRALMDEADRRILLAGKEEAKRKVADSIIADLGSPQPATAERPVAGPQRSTGSAVAPDGPSPARQPEARRETPNLPREQDLFPPEPEPDSPDFVDRKTSSAPRPVSPPISKPAGDGVKVYSRPAIKRSETVIEPVIPVRERVLDLSLKGFSAEMIAHTLSISLGEVELILDMNDSSL